MRSLPETFNFTVEFHFRYPYKFSHEIIWPFRNLYGNLDMLTYLFNMAINCAIWSVLLCLGVLLMASAQSEDSDILWMLSDDAFPFRRELSESHVRILLLIDFSFCLCWWWYIVAHCNNWYWLTWSLWQANIDLRRSDLLILEGLVVSLFNPLPSAYIWPTSYLST